MRNQLAMPRRQSAFTLIELLVVIAIIGLLISLLSPSLSRAMESARGIACAGNLRQHGVAMQLFMGDHDGEIPIRRRHPDGSDQGRFGTLNWRLLPYLYPEAYAAARAGQSSYASWVYGRPHPDRPSTVFICPSYPSNPPPGSGSFSYYSTQYFRADGDNSGRVPVPLERGSFPYIWIQQPARVLVLVDAIGMLYHDATHHDRLMPRHNDRLNVLFADFHVEPFSVEDITRDGASGPDPKVVWDWR